VSAASAGGHARIIRPRLAAIPLALACLAAALYLALASEDAARVDRANRLGESGRHADALAEARRVRRAPADARAAVVEAYALRELGRLRGAERAFARAVAHLPNDWALRRDHAAVLLALGDRESAAGEMARAAQLNPRMVLPDGFRRAVRTP
jgi:tetratricopeptide (TPR) repeat protein